MRYKVTNEGKLENKSLRKLRAILWVLVYPTLLKFDLIKRIKKIKEETF